MLVDGWKLHGKLTHHCQPTVKQCYISLPMSLRAEVIVGHALKTKTRAVENLHVHGTRAGGFQRVSVGVLLLVGSLS